MKKKKLFSLVLATVLTAATVLPCYGASTKEKISNAQAEQAAAQSQLDSIQSRIDELNSKKGQSEEYLSELNQQLDDLQNRLQELQDQYDAEQNDCTDSGRSGRCKSKRRRAVRSDEAPYPVYV